MARGLSLTEPSTRVSVLIARGSLGGAVQSSSDMRFDQIRSLKLEDQSVVLEFNCPLFGRRKFQGTPRKIVLVGWFQGDTTKAFLG